MLCRTGLPRRLLFDNTIVRPLNLLAQVLGLPRGIRNLRDNDLAGVKAYVPAPSKWRPSVPPAPGPTNRGWHCVHD